MPTVLDTTGLDRLRARLARVANPNPADLLLRCENVLDEDNRRGVLAGQDKDGAPLAPVTYRPLRPGEKSVKLTVEQRLGQKARMRRGEHKTIGSGPQRAWNNLTSAEYRLLDGPPLAPRRQFSRVITNYRTGSGEGYIPGTWEVTGQWVNVLTRKGLPFLHYHFDGLGQKQRDLRGIRPWGMDKIRSAVRAWMISTIQSAG